MRILLALCAVVGVVSDAKAEKFYDLGPQITSSLVIGTTFSQDAKTVYTVMRGHPAKLLAFDVNTGEMLHRMPLEGAHGAWNACTASDGSIYVGSDDNAHLYRYIPGETEVHDLGLVLPNQTFVWDVCAGKDGEVFGGTYPGCQVFRYHPSSGFTEISHGAAAAGENYARSVTYDAATGKIYVGVGSHPHLIELDPKTGEKTDLLPKEYRDNEFVYGVEVLGDKLYAYISRLGKSLVIDTKTHEVLTILPAMAGQQLITRSPDDGKVYYVVGGKLTCFDPATLKPPKPVASCGNALAYTWSDQKLLIFVSGSVEQLDPATQKLSRLAACKMPAEETDIQSIELGPDGRIWTGGYLSGGNAAFDPNTGKSEQFKGLSQSEDITVVGSTLYFGLYPGARLALYDTSNPWDSKKNNPRQFADLGPEDQSRPMAMCGVESLGKVFIGTVPEYGKLSGVLAVYDIKSNKIEVHHDVVPKQSIVSLVYCKNLIIGGSSIWGGLGQQPQETGARLFVWDPETNKKVFEIVAVEGAKAITGLFTGPDGSVWGMAEGTLFSFDPVKREVTFSKKILPVQYDLSKTIWRDAFFAVHPSGQIYGVMRDRFFRLNPQTKEVTILRDKGAGLLAMDRDGGLYFRDGTHLWRYEP
jgi:outer membrane protein assembly factor BamB